MELSGGTQPGAATGRINYYRSSVRTPPKKAEAAIRPIKAPTLVIWGQRDRYLGEELAEPDHDDVPGLDRVERLPDASHWVHHDEAQRVNQLLTDFFAPVRPARSQELTRDLCRATHGQCLGDARGGAVLAHAASRRGRGQTCVPAWPPSV